MTQIDYDLFDTPGRGRGILDVFGRGYLLRLLIRKGTATRYRNSVLGWTWSYVKPAAQFVIYYVVMGLILQLHRDMENFAVYLFSGVVVVNMFNEAFGNATHSIVDNRALVKKIYLPRELFPIAAIAGALIHSLPQIAILLAVCLLMGWTPTLIGLAMIVVALLLVVGLALGLGLLFAGINVRYRDAQNVVDIIRMFSTWTSPVLYSWVMLKEAMPDWVFGIYMSNPLTVAVEFFHTGFWARTTTENHGLPDGMLQYSITAAAICLAVLVLGQFVFRRFERSFAQDL